jgi:hypothetical protein
MLFDDTQMPADDMSATDETPAVEPAAEETPADEASA